MSSVNAKLELNQAGETATLREHQEAIYLLLCEFDRACKQLQIPYFLFAGTLIGAVRHKGFIPWDDDLDVLMMREDYDRFLREAPDVLPSSCFLQKEFSPHWPMCFSKLRLNGTACLEKYHPKDPASHQGVYIDIFPCDHAFSSEFGRKAQFFCSKVVIAKSLDRRGYDTDSTAKKLFMYLCRLLPRGVFLRFTKGPKKQGKFVHTFLGGASKYAKNVYPAACFSDTVLLPFEDGVFPAPKAYDDLLTIVYGDYKKLPSEEKRKYKKHAVLVDLKHPYTQYEHYRDNMTFDIPLRSIR